MSDQYDRVLLRLSSTEDDKLGPVLAKLLPLVFDELLTQTDAPQRAKIVNILNHVLTRAKGNPAIQLPSSSIAERWFSPTLKSSPNAPFFRNLSNIFLDLSVPRLAPTQQIDLALYALDHFGQLQAGADRAILFLLCIPGLGQISAEGLRKEQVPRCLSIISKHASERGQGIVDFFGAAREFLLIPCGAVEAPSVGGLASASWSYWKAKLKTKSVADMIAMKTSVLKWLGSLGADPPASLVYLPSLAACVENYDAVSNLADNNCKRLDPELDLGGDTDLICRMMCAVLTCAPPGHEDDGGILRVETKANVPMKLRLKVLMLLQRSTCIGKTSIIAHTVHLVRQSLRDHEQVQTAALQLVTTLAQHVDPEHLVSTCSSIITEIELVYWQGGGVISMGPATPLAFRVFGNFVRTLSEHPSGEGRMLALRTAPRVLKLLAANEAVAHDILEALTGLVACIVGTAEDEYKEFIPLLDELVNSPKPVVRREVLRWASSLFPPTSPEGRYYALRMLGDTDPDAARSAEALLSSSSRELPPFADMCQFLATRALASGEGSIADRLDKHAAGLAAIPVALPALAAGFTQHAVAQALHFLLRLAEAEGLGGAAEEASPPVAKKARLVPTSPASKGKEVSMESVAAFVAFLDYLLAGAIEGSPTAMSDVTIDGRSIVDIALPALLLAAQLAHAHASLRSILVHRAELTLFGASGSGLLFRDGGSSARRARQHGAKILGVLCEQLGEDAAQGWMNHASEALDSAPGSAKRAGGILGVCELLRSSEFAAVANLQCRKCLNLLLAGDESDTAVLAATCDGLRRLSEVRPLVWESLDAAESGNASKKALIDRLYALTAPITCGTGDTKEGEVGVLGRQLVHSSWRLLGQLAAWGGEGSEDCIDRLIEIGKHSTGEEAIAALGLALSAAASNPSDPAGPTALTRVEALLSRLLILVGESKDINEPEAENSKLTAAEKDANQRCGAVWLAVLLRQLTAEQRLMPWLPGLLDPLSRACVRTSASLSVFVADCSMKALCHLYRLAPPDCRTELLKTIFSSLSNRTVVSNVFVGTPDTKTRQDAKEAEEKAGHNSLKITAKERMDLIKDLMFLAREVQHPPLFIALLDQPVSSIWTGEVFREALDLQSSCLPVDLHEHLCPASLRPKLYPYFFHPNGPLRQTMVALSASYFLCESSQQLASKFPEEWPNIAKHLVSALGSAKVVTREAAIQATQTVFRGKTWSEVGFIMEDLWTIVIRLMDDMEDQIQVAVKPLVRMLRNLTLRLCDEKAGSSTHVHEAIKTLVPLLLKFCERYAHAQPVCFDLMREMVKAAHGTALLSPFVPDLVPSLLRSLSLMENSNLQYWQFHVDAKSEDKGKELEAARISNSRDSDSMKLLRLLVPLITEENAQAVAPRSRELLSRGVGANTRVGVCDFWAAVCAERASAVPSGGQVACSMLRSLAGALLDSSTQVRNAAASCFASFARRNSPQELTKVISERLIRRDQDFRTDDAQRNDFRIALARALWEVCRRCDDATIEPELKGIICAKAFGLRYSSEQEVKSSWESLWNELCPTISGGIEKYRSLICQDLAVAFAESASRPDKISMAKAVSAMCAQLEKIAPRPKWQEDASLTGLFAEVLANLQSLPVFDGTGILVRAFADLAALLHRRKRGEDTICLDEASLGLPTVQPFATKGSLADRAAAIRAMQEMMSAARLWWPLEEIWKLYTSVSDHVDQLEKEVEAEKREPGEPVPRRHRGKGQSPAEELLTATLDFWACALEQCRREVEDEGDIEPPEEEELGNFVSATLSEFSAGSLTMRLAMVRVWKHVFDHFIEEKVQTKKLLASALWQKLAAALQDASLDPRSERLRRPALECAASLANDDTPGGAGEGLQQGIQEGAAAEASNAAPKVMNVNIWASKLDPVTAEQCSKSIVAIRRLEEKAST